MKSCLLLSLLCAASVAFAAPEVKIGGKRLRVVMDARLTPEIVERDWASGSPRPEAPAALELVGGEGRVLDRLMLAAPLAKLDPAPVRGAPYPTFLVSADLTAEAGSYNGPLTLPVQIIGDHLVATVARVAGQRTEPIRLTASGKAAWQRIPNGKAETLLSVGCKPSIGQGFVTVYRRYFPSGQGWKVRERTRPGLWESDGDFPARKLFP